MSNIYVRILHTRSAGSNVVYIDDFSITLAAAVPAITISDNGTQVAAGNIEDGTVKGKTVRPMFYRTKNKNEKVKLTPFLSNGERVFLTIFPNEKGVYSQFIVEKSLSNTVRDTDNESDYTC